MTTTVNEVRKFMQTALDNEGENGAVEYAETADQEFDDLESVATQRGEQARWGTRDWIVYRNGDGALIGIQIYAGATENQESFYEGIVSAMTSDVQAETVYIPEGD